MISYPLRGFLDARVSFAADTFGHDLGFFVFGANFEIL